MDSKIDCLRAEVLRLRADVDVLATKVEDLRDKFKCDHLRVEHRLFPDIYAGQGESSKCLECGKFMGCSTYPASPVVTKTWVEDRSAT